MPRAGWGQYVPYRWSGLLRCLGAQRPVAPPARRGSPFLPRNGKKEGRGCAPGPRGSWPALSRSLVLGIVIFGTIVGLFRPVCQDRFGTHFREKYAGTHFCERKFPNQGTQMGAEIAQRPEQCATTAKTSERKRAGHKTGGPGGTAPGALSSGFLRRKPGSPAGVGGGNHLAGPALRRS